MPEEEKQIEEITTTTVGDVVVNDATNGAPTTNTTTPTTSDEIDDLRQRGNHEFQSNNIDNAITFYTMAIDKCLELNPKYNAEVKQQYITNLCNRSACYYTIEEYIKARDDAATAWDISDNDNVKAAYRLSKTCIALHEYYVAINTINLALASLQYKLTEKEITSLKELLVQAKKLQDKQDKDGGGPNDSLMKNETTIKGVDYRPISIKEFTKGKSLGVGNFSEIVIAKHNHTQETFALKILEKKQAMELAKRQHPNVHNEIAMEARILLSRLPPHPYVITMYHSFQDYYNLYYLMDLHDTNVKNDLWSHIKYKNKMVGCYPSLIKRWLYQLIDAIQHIHSHGIVHRDLKPENILLNKYNDIVVIDFGTAKDLIKTDLNGPEFVGTPDFMSPEAVTGFSGMPEKLTDKDLKEKLEKGATHCADLWALGGVAYILLTGETPFWCPSPYLTFLRIKRGLLRRSQWGIPDDDAWDFISKLMKVNPNERFGSDCYLVNTVTNKLVINKGYDILRNHKYFDGIMSSQVSSSSSSPSKNAKPINHGIPSLKDLCIRACAELAIKDAQDVDLCDKHPPGDNSSHDMTRLPPYEKIQVLHIIDKLRLFSNGDETRILQRFFKTDQEYIECKVRGESRDFVGLTQMNDNEYKPLTARGNEDPYAKKDDPVPMIMVHVTNPLLLPPKEGDGSAVAAVDDDTRKKYLKGWKKCIASINRSRPKLVVVSGNISDKYRKFLSRVSDTIHVILNDGSAFYTFWYGGFQGMVLQSKTLLQCKNLKELKNCPQVLWIRELMEQCRMSKHQLFCFVDCDPRDLPPYVVKVLARGHVLLLVGLSNTDEAFETTITYHPNEKLDDVKCEDGDDDDASIKSTDSEEDKDDSFTMKVVGTKENAMRRIIVQEKGDYETEFEAVEMA